MYCSQCGKEIHNDSAYCGYCGHTIENEHKFNNAKKINKSEEFYNRMVNKYGWKYKIVSSIIAVLFIVSIFKLMSYFDEVDYVNQSFFSQEQAEILSNATSSKLKPSGKLYEMFKAGSDYTDVQRENMEQSMIGQVIKWHLPVYEVHRIDGGYKIFTSNSNGNLFDMTRYVNTEAHIYTESSSEKTYIENLKTNDMITIKGYISKVDFLRTIVIKPCIIIK